jgi:hypothetical protein
MSTSRSYLAKRLKAIGRDDLLEAADRGEVTLHSAALWAGLITQQRVPEGNGSPNVSKRKAWALLRAERRGASLAPKPDPQPENSPEPAQPKFSQTRTIVERLVAADRADLIVALVERRIGPFQAARIADRGMPPRRTAPEKKTEPEPPGEPEVMKKRLAGEPEVVNKPPRIDVRALIG